MPAFSRETSVKSNYPGDREYTLNATAEELALMERHLRDGSWKLCDCIPEKHLPTLAGLASEGYGFATSQDEKQFMAQVRDKARTMMAHIANTKLTEREADELREWARQYRHIVTKKDFSGSISKCTACGETDDLVRELSDEASSQSVYEGINISPEVHRSELTNMATRREMYQSVGLVYASDHIGKGLDKGFSMLDSTMGRAGAAVEQRPSTWLNVGLGIGLPIMAVFAKVKAPYNILMIGLGGFLSTRIWDYVEELSAPAARMGIRGVPSNVTKNPLSYAPSVTPAPAPAIRGPQNGRYQVIS